MLKSAFLLLFAFVTFHTALAQRFQIEPYLGTQHVHHHGCTLDDKSIHRGCTMSTGLRFHFNFNKRFGIVPGYTMNNIIGDNYKFPLEHILRLDFKYNFLFLYDYPRFNLTAETGIEWVYFNKKIKFPLYLGAQYNLNSLSDLFFRVRIPNLVQLDILSLYQFVEVGAEIGITFNPNWCYHPKYNTPGCGGNPFILL